MFVSHGLRLLFRLADNDNGVDAVIHFAAKSPYALFHEADLMIDSLQALFVIGAVLVIIYKPGVTFGRDDIHSVIGAAGRKNRRMRRADRARRHARVLHLVEFTLQREAILSHKAFHHLDEFLHLPVAAAVGLDPAPVHIVLLRAGAVDDVYAKASAANAINRGGELCHNARIGNARMDSRHDIHLADDGREGCCVNPRIEIRPKPALRNQCDIEAELFRTVQQFHRIFKILVNAPAIGRERIKRRPCDGIGPDALGRRGPDAKTHNLLPSMRCRRPGSPDSQRLYSAG